MRGSLRSTYCADSSSCHIALAHLAAGLIALSTGFGTSVLGNFFLSLPDGWGFGLAGVYLAWVGVLAVLYPACRWFARVKRRRTDWWLAYLWATDAPVCARAGWVYHARMSPVAESPRKRAAPRAGSPCGTDR